MFCINNDTKTAKNSSSSIPAPPIDEISQHRLISTTIKLPRLKNLSNRNVCTECFEKLNSECLPWFVIKVFNPI